MEEAETKGQNHRIGMPTEKSHERTKDEPELTVQLEAVRHIMKKYSESLQRLADS